MDLDCGVERVHGVIIVIAQLELCHELHLRLDAVERDLLRVALGIGLLASVCAGFNVRSTAFTKGTTSAAGAAK